MNLHENLKPFLSIPPQVIDTDTVDGAAFDAANYKDAIAILAVGNVAATATVNGVLQHSDDDQNWDDVPGEAITEIDDSGDDALGTVLKYRRHAGSYRRYLRWSVTVAGGAAEVCAMIVGGNPAQAPV